MGRSGPIRRVAKVFAKTATVRVAIGPLAPGRRAMAIAPVVIGLRENLAVTRSSRAALRIARATAEIVAARQEAARDVEASLRSRGFSEVSPLARHGHLYHGNAVDPAGNLVEVNWPDVTTLDRGLIPEIQKIGGSKDAVLYLDPPAR